MRALFSNLLTASVSGSIVILAVLVLRLVLRKTPKKFICILWICITSMVHNYIKYNSYTMFMSCIYKVL